MTLSLVILLWLCCAVAAVALVTLQPQPDRPDELKLNQVVLVLIMAPLALFGAAVAFTISWSEILDPVIWRRK
jgi:hypothetical protein